ncbi:MAG: PDZ domain-containing protein [Candidatus Zixiibacteriota bacterium]|nr:MAG: PDZ domain-containing protein [candidate division Zixibacteria bacterium]
MNLSERFVKPVKPFLPVVFAFLLVGLGILLVTGCDWPPSSQADSQASAASEVAKPTADEFLPNKEAFLSGPESPFVRVAETVSPAVVNIRAEKVVKGTRYHDSSPFDDFFRRFFGEVPERRPPAQRGQSLGSGFIFREDGYILTNNHVVSGADNISVTLPNGSTHTAEVVGLDRDTDIAVLKIEVEEKLPSAGLGDSDALKVGEWVMAIGNPFPELGLDRTVTVGVVSAKGRGNLYFGPEDTPQYQNYIQTDASINPGNSGGPLVNIRGEVVGINSAITNPTGVGFNIGIGFAIPIDLAKSVIPDLVEKGKVSRGFIGIGLQDINRSTADALDLPSTEGVLVREVEPGTPAEKAGVEIGDVITGFNGKRVVNGQELMIMVAAKDPGDEVTLDILRKGSRLTKNLTLTDRDMFVSRAGAPTPQEEEEQEWLGLQVSTSTRDLVGQYNVKFKPGVIVVQVDPGSAAEEGGLRTGDIIVKMDDREIEDSDDYRRAVTALKDKKKAVLLLVYRNGEPLFAAVKPG